MKVRALVKSYYNRRDVQAGEEYEMDDRERGEANILVALGKIEILEGVTMAKPIMRQQLMTRAEEPEQQAEEPTKLVGPMTTDSALVPPGRRTYRRRDMKAEK